MVGNLPGLFVLTIWTALTFLSSPFVQAAPSRFLHPGVFLSRARLELIRIQVRRGEEPWASAYDAMLAFPMAALNRTATPYENVECGSNSIPNIGCTPERQDALASYAMSLAWYISREEKYALKAVEYLNAWGAMLKSHNGSNAPLQTGWSAASWARSAEIIRYTYGGWQQSDIAQFETMLRTAYVPQLLVGSNSNGNWELVMMEAAIGISVFLSDGSIYDQAVTRFLSRIPAYLYLESDGPLPAISQFSTTSLNTEAKLIKYWQYQSTFMDGLAQETCRDFTHSGYGISSISHGAETLRLQGLNLYTTAVNATTFSLTTNSTQQTPVKLATRLSKALEFHAQYEPNGGNVPAPTSLCNGTLNLGLGPVTEVPFMALHSRLRMNLPFTEQVTLAQRPAGTNYLFVGWETLTSAGLFE
ncbi:hypothetical protein FRC14_006843 [Serendipita sp. 396]|nr:hypothetical protein FRC14_006843 [Serendipita sp. 396]KAG8789194.1 hypothetical protein FRC15_010686 [Serendipita sp. 397]KAG8804336.1 hypothetical protein FRC16_009549 [Serendipita sp. 398]KAG8877804.1 hypothetical protein FRC20_010056 [Serendipita sp. 405]